MLLADNNRVASRHMQLEHQEAAAVAFDFGIAHQTGLIKLKALHLNIEKWVGTLGTAYLLSYLSANPNHLIAPLGTVPGIFSDQSIYALAHWRQMNSADINRYFETMIIPLWDIVVPFRQVWGCLNWTEATIWVRAEVYYETIKESMEESITASRQRGAYRRT